MSLRLLAVSAGLSGLVLSCSGGDEPSTTPPRKPPTKAADDKGYTAKDMKEAKIQYRVLCVTCHGETGKGDGPGAAGIKPAPRDFGDPEWQASVTDEHLKTVILRGGAAVGKSPQMPPQPQLKSRPKILKALIAFIRGLKKKS